MLKFIGQRLAMLVALLLAVSALTFAATMLLGDPLQTIFGPTLEDPRFADEVAQARSDFNLDKPLPQRYVLWLGDVLQGDFQNSYTNRTTVTSIVKNKLPVSLLLAGMALVLAVVLAIPWALWSASRANSLSDKASTFVSFGFVSIPNFALGVVIYYVFLVKLEWFPIKFIDDEGLGQRLWSLLPAAITLALPIAAVYQRLLRTDLITTLQDDFILMARAKGVSKTRVLFGHALRPSMFSFITVFGINAGALIGGALVVERIFGIPGAGNEIVEAILRNDFPVVLALVLIITAGFVTLNLLVDILYSVLDPRVRA